MPPKRRASFQFEYQPLTDIMADLEQYLDENWDSPKQDECDLWFAQILYNLAKKMVEVQSVQRVAVDLLQRSVEEMRENAKKETKGRRRGK